MSLNEVGGHCPTCGAEYRPGFEVCADDGTPLVAGPAPEPLPEAETLPEPERGVRYRPVASFPTVEIANLLAGRLRAEGITAVVQAAATFDMYGRGTISLGGQNEVLVPADDLEEARRLIAEIDAG